MATLDEEDLVKLGGGGSSSETSPWTRLQLPAASTPSSPFYLKLLHLTSPYSSRLVAVLTDLKTGVYSETFESARSILVRLRVSNNNSTHPDSGQGAAQLEGLSQDEAVQLLFTQLRDWYGHAGPKAALETRNDDELELLVEFESLAFRFRMDKVSSANLQIRILHNMLLQPALGLIQTLMSLAPQGLQATQEAIDSSASDSHQPDPVLLSAVHRYAQTAASLDVTKRIAIKPLTRKPIVPKKRKADSPEHAKSPTAKTATSPQKMEVDDPDATMASNRTSTSPMPGSSRKGKEREAEVTSPASREDDAGGDSDATQASDDDGDDSDIQPPSSSKRTSAKRPIARSPTPEPAAPSTSTSSHKRASSGSPPLSAGGDSPAPHVPKAKKTEQTPQVQQQIGAAPAPSIPILARGGPTAATRARGRGIGRGAAGQWTRFG